MADKGDKADDKSEKSEKKQKSNLVPAIVLAVGIAAAGYFLGPGKGGPADAKEEKKEEEAKPLGPVSVMDPISVNLADGHYLKVGLGVQLSAEAKAEEFKEGPIERVKDMLISEVGGGKMEDFATPEGRELLKEELRESAKEQFHGEVVDFYFTDFVMQ